MALLDRFNDSELVSDLDEAVAHGRAATAGLSVGGEEWAHASVLLSTLLHVRYRCIESLADLDEAISAAKVGVAAVPQDTPGIAGTLFTIGNMFAERYGHSRARADLDEAVTFGRHALAAARPEDPDREWVLFGLGLALASRQEISPDAEDLDQAVRVLDELMSLTPVHHAQRGLRLTMFSSALAMRARRTDDVQDLAGAAQLARDATAVTPVGDQNHVMVLLNLGEVLQGWHAHTRDIDDLDEAIAALREANAAAPGLPGLVQLRNALTTRWIRAGDPASLDEAVALARDVVTSTPPERPDRARQLSRLAHALRLRIERTGTPEDIDEAVDVGGEAVAAMPDDHADRGVTVAHLAAVHLARYEQRGVADDLEQAVMLWRAAVAAAPVGNPNRLGLLAGLCHALRVRFEVNSVWADIVEAVDAGRAAVASEIKEDLLRGVALVNLASALMARFMFRGSRDDVEEAITACRDALSTVPDDSLNRPILLSVLGGALARRFTLTHERGFVTDLSELAEALAACREAVAVTAPDDPRRSAFLTQLGFVLQIWSSRGEAVGTSDLDEAIDVCREAVAAVATNHPMRAHLLINLAESLRDRFMKTNVGADLVEAAEVGAEGVALLGADDPTRTDALITYGDVLRRLWVYTDNSEYAVSSMTVCREAATLPSGRVRMRIGAAYDWGRVAAALEEWESATEAYAKAVELRPMMAWRGLNRADRERLLDLAPELGGNAAACAIAAGEPDRAMELLEWSRGVLWSQMLDTRSDLTALRDAAPDLAAEMATVQAELDGQGGGDPQELGHQWDELLDRIRTLPGFESFLLQPLAKDLRVAAADGPVVIVNVSEWRCDALVVTTTETHVVSLPELTYDEAWDRTRHYFAAAEYLDQALHSPAALDRSNMAIADTMDWLWETITKPVLGFLGYVETPSQGRPWPRLWWCPCGPLALLPIHAAAGSDGHGVLDRVVSSYTPTLRALIGARLAEFDADTSNLLVVAMPETPGHAALPFVGAERDTLVGAFPDACTLLEGHGATRCAVHDELARHRWAHFSCHGFQDLHNPSDAGLIVHDGAISLADLTAGDRQSGEWVFLSACKTATGGFKNTDEVITLASALVYSGWRHVIGTLWTVMDSTAAKIAGEVYRSVAADGLLQSDRAAVALHDAVRKVRAAKQDQPGLWAPFVHIGP